MLPGFRFLFAAIVLSMSILVFGLGAAALLRAAHEEFASNPSWRAPPETMFAQQVEATRPVLAMLQIEPLPEARKAPDSVPVVAAPAEPAAMFPASVQPEGIAALNPRETSAPEAAMPEIPVREGREQSEAAAAQADALSVADIGIAAPDAVEPAASGQMSTQASPEIDAASTKIATLGGPPVTIKTPPRGEGRQREETPRGAGGASAQDGGARAARGVAGAAAGQPARSAIASAAGGRAPLNQAGPVATGGPSGRPHSAHEPS